MGVRMTVGELREAIRDLPNTMKVIVECNGEEFDYGVYVTDRELLVCAGYIYGTDRRF